MRRTPSLLVLVLFLLAVGPLTFGDTLYLRNDQSFQGKLVKETATHYFFKIKGLGEQKFAKSEVLKVEKNRDVFDVFAEKKKALKPGDAEGHYQLGLWCKKNDMRKEAKAEFEAAVKANPDHAGARDELGFVKYEGEWITKEKHAKILAEIAKREAEILGKLHLDKAIENAKARFSFQPPADWKKEEKSATHLVFTGPVLGKAPLTLEFEATDAGDSLDEMAKSVADSVKLAHEDATQGEPKTAQVGSQAAKLLVFDYVRSDLAPEDLGMERHDLLTAGPAGNFRLSLEIRQGYWDRLKPFFDKIAATLKILDKPPDVDSKEWGISLCFPDDTYVAIDNFQIPGPNGMQVLPKAPIAIGSKSTQSTLLVVYPGKKGDGKVDATSLATLRDSIGKISRIGNFLAAADQGTSTKVAGVDALEGNLTIADGKLGNGRWCVFLKGDRYFRVLFINLFSQMGDQYLIKDFGKFLASIRVK